MSSDHAINRLFDAGAPDFVTRDPRVRLDQAIAHFEAATGRTLSPMQVETYLLETIAYMLSLRGAQEQLALANSFVAYAAGDWLDRFGAERNTPRLPAGPARTVLEFTVTPGALRNIPAGTRVSNGQSAFRTTTRIPVPAAATSVSGPAEAVDTGVTANGIAVGALTQMLDQVAGVTAVTNTAATEGGTVIEDDRRYRARLAQAYERISRGGSREGYGALVTSWSTRVVDVAVLRPAPGEIEIYPLLSAGQLSAPERTELRDWLYDGRVPMGDDLTIINPADLTFDVPLHLVVSDDGQTVQLATAAVQRVLDAWAQRLGGYVAPSELIAVAREVPGVIDATITGLAFAAVDEHTRRLGTLIVTHTVQ